LVNDRQEHPGWRPRFPYDEIKGDIVMRKHLVAGAATLALMMPVTASAQTPVEDGARAGAMTAGPVGAIVGGAVGAAVAIPASVLGFVATAPGPSVVIEQPIVVGEPLPDRVRVRPIPRSEYRYAVVNGQRVIVDPTTRRIVRIMG
jgi:Protein of unknown function (DUF1236)